jgi:hypothetical protein
VPKGRVLPVALYGCGTWSLTLKVEGRLEMLERRVLRTIFGLTRDEVTGRIGRLHKEGLIFCLPHRVLFV